MGRLEEPLETVIIHNQQGLNNLAINLFNSFKKDVGQLVNHEDKEVSEIGKYWFDELDTIKHLIGLIQYPTMSMRLRFKTWILSLRKKVRP